jgi:hypothetical protein
MRRKPSAALAETVDPATTDRQFVIRAAAINYIVGHVGAIRQIPYVLVGALPILGEKSAARAEDEDPAASPRVDRTLSEFDHGIVRPL